MQPSSTTPMLVSIKALKSILFSRNQLVSFLAVLLKSQHRKWDLSQALLLNIRSSIYLPKTFATLMVKLPALFT